MQSYGKTAGIMRWLSWIFRTMQSYDLIFSDISNVWDFSVRKRMCWDLERDFVKHHYNSSTKFTLASILTMPSNRIMTMNPLYPCGKPCSTGTHNETVKKLTQFSAFINRIMMESRLRISIPCQSNRKLYHIYTVTIVIHKSRNLIGTLGIAEFGPKQGHVFQSNIMSLCWPKRHHQAKEHGEIRDSRS